MVKEEITKEMVEFEKGKGEMDRVKRINEKLRKRLEDESIEFSEDVEEMDDDEDNSKKKKKKMVSVGVSAESLLNLNTSLNQKIEDVIEEKSRSIVNLLT